MKYIIDEEELFKLVKEHCYTVHTNNMINLEVSDFLKSKQSVELVAKGKVTSHYDDYYVNEKSLTYYFNEIDDKFLNGDIKIYIEKVETP